MKNERKNVQIDQIIEKILKADFKAKSFVLSQEQIFGVCFLAKTIMMSQPILLELYPPINVCGDFHGQFQDLRKMFALIGSPQENQNFLFLGDYIDRGKYSLQCICLLLAFKVKYKENFFLLRGNHQCSQTNKVYGFYDQCKRRSTLKVWKAFSDCFNCFPIAAVIGNRIFCVHGGLSPHLVHISTINQIKRPTEMQKDTLLCDLLWSDPFDGIGWQDNFERGVSYYFGKNVIKDFLNNHDFDLICRSHQVLEDGYSFYNNKSLLSIFSAPNYCGQHDNYGAVLIVQQDMKCHIKQLQKSAELKFNKKRNATPIPGKFKRKDTIQSNSSLQKVKRNVKVLSRQRTPTKFILK